jgi:hypothetical protein
LRSIVEPQRAEFRAVAAFRRRHLAALADLFGDVVQAVPRGAGTCGAAALANDGTSCRPTRRTRARLGGF